MTKRATEVLKYFANSRVSRMVRSLLISDQLGRLNRLSIGICRLSCVDPAFCSKYTGR